MGIVLGIGTVNFPDLKMELKKSFLDSSGILNLGRERTSLYSLKDYKL